MPTKKEFLTISVKRLPNKTEFFIKSCDELEEFFKSLAQNQKFTSGRWLTEDGEGQNFYELTRETQEKLDKLSTCNYFNDVGAYLVSDKNEAINLAMLRAVGIKNGITIVCNNDRLSLVDNFDIEAYVKKVAQYAKAMYNRFIEKREVKATISLEI